MIPAVAIPAFIALVSKLGLLAYSLSVRKQGSTAHLVAILLIVLLLANAVEFVGLSVLEGNITPLLSWIGFTYFASFVIAMTLIVHTAFRLSFDFPANDPRMRLQFLFYAPMAVLVYLLLATDLVVAGFQTFQSTILRVPGPLYVLFESYVTIYLVISVASLIYGARGSRNPAARRNRNQLLLLALLPTGLLLLYLFIGNYWYLPRLTSTIYLPIPLTLFLLVATYSTHSYRVWDLSFVVPGSKVRRRKSEFYRRVQGLVTQITEDGSVENVLGDLTNAMDSPVAVISDHQKTPASASSSQPADKADLLRFPLEELRRVDHMTVADEIADSAPKLYRLMISHKIGAIVPLISRGAESARWILVGDKFSNLVYSPGDFERMETLFNHIGDRLSENILPLRSQLDDLTKEIEELKQRLAIVWDELSTERQSIDLAQAENRRLRDVDAQRQAGEFSTLNSGVPESIALGAQTLEQYLRQREAEIVAIALERCHGDTTRTAHLLGLPMHVLYHLIERYSSSPK